MAEVSQVGSRSRQMVAIFLVSLAGLLLEVGYTRIVGYELLVGSAAGNEILASLHFHAQDIEAVELNPVTLSLLTDHFADYTGISTDQPGVSLHNGDGRSYLARSDKKYDLIWFVAPDSYAAINAASSGAFVLSESYLYTSEMIAECLRAPHRRRDHGRAVRRARLHGQAEPHRALHHDGARRVRRSRDRRTPAIT